MKKTANKLATEVFAWAKPLWWTDLKTGQALNKNRGELLMLVITELSEGVHGIRKNLMDDKLPSRLMEEVEMADAYIRLVDYCGGFNIDLGPLDSGMLIDEPTIAGIKDNKAEAILIISGRVCSAYECLSSGDSAGERNSILQTLFLIEAYCVKNNLDLEGAIEEKMIYNHHREDHKAEARLKPDGKRF